MEHPADIGRGVTTYPTACYGLVDMGVIDVFGMGVVARALLDHKTGTGLSQKHCWSR